MHSQGDVAYCPAKGPCKKASGNVGFKYPNGLVRGKDGKIYVPSSWLGKWWIFEAQDDFSLKKIEELAPGMPVDNISVDEDGDIYAAAFPDALQFVRTLADPYQIESPTTIWKFTRSIGSDGKVSYLQQKVIEDKYSQGIGGATIAVHDSKTGRLFLGGMFRLDIDQGSMTDSMQAPSHRTSASVIRNRQGKPYPPRCNGGTAYQAFS